MRKLVLLHPLDGTQEFIVGVNCDELERLEYGGFWIVRGNRRDAIGPARVDHYTEEPRPGLAPEPSKPKAERNGLSPEPEKLPRGVKRSGDEYGCEVCPYTSTTLHGVKVHRAMVHQGA